jgi:DNA-binding LacI/PurR family transcriptional regulator
MHAKTTKPRGAVTIKQVAAAADVAVGTVSRVINGHEDVDVGLRARVENVIRDLGYRPNILAQNFVRNRSPILSFVLGNSGVQWRQFAALVQHPLGRLCAGDDRAFSRSQGTSTGAVG